MGADSLLGRWEILVGLALHPCCPHCIWHAALFNERRITRLPLRRSLPKVIARPACVQRCSNEHFSDWIFIPVSSGLLKWVWSTTEDPFYLTHLVEGLSKGNGLVLERAIGLNLERGRLVSIWNTVFISVGALFVGVVFLLVFFWCCFFFLCFFVGVFGWCFVFFWCVFVVGFVSFAFLLVFFSSVFLVVSVLLFLFSSGGFSKLFCSSGVFF